VPRKAVADDDDEMPPPRRRSRAAAATVDANDERSLVMRVLLHSPKDSFAALIAIAAAVAIIANALFLQHGPHPAPMFGSVVHMPAPSLATVSLLPRPRPAEAGPAAYEPQWLEPRATGVRPVERVEPRSADPLGNLVKATTTGALPSATAAMPPTSVVLRPPAPIPPVQVTGSHRVAAVQRVLTEYGYGQLRATGTIGADTQAAIQKFERDRKLPVTGQVSDRLVRELSAMIGHSID
jgi:hypothetical protein